MRFDPQLVVGTGTLSPHVTTTRMSYGRRLFIFFNFFFLAYIGACADWRGSPALSKALEAVGGKGLGWVCSVLGMYR